MRIFVANIPFHFREPDIQDLFGLFGIINSVKLLTEPDGKSKGFGFVNMLDDEKALKAISSLNERDIDGRILVVKQADEPPAEVPTQKRVRKTSAVIKYLPVSINKKRREMVLIYKSAYKM